MQRTCDTCGKAYEAKRSDSKNCGATCRSRAHKGLSPKVAPLSAAPVASPLVAAVRRELEEVGRLDTATGQAAVGLAERLAAGGDTGSATASLTKELRATMEAALSGARVAASPLEQQRDELAERRRQRSA